MYGWGREDILCGGRRGGGSVQDFLGRVLYVNCTGNSSQLRISALLFLYKYFPEPDFVTYDVNTDAIHFVHCSVYTKLVSQFSLWPPQLAS